MWQQKGYEIFFMNFLRPNLVSGLHTFKPIQPDKIENLIFLNLGVSSFE